MKAAARRPWRAGGRPGRRRARRAGRPRTGPERTRQGRAAERGSQPWTEAGRGRVASRAIRRRGGDGARAGRGRRRNGRAGAARWNAGDDPGPGRADAAWHRGRSGGGGAKERGRAEADAGTGGPTPSPKGGDPSLPLHPPETNSRGRRTPPTDSWGVRRPRGGQDARPIRPRMGPGREQAPRRPHDAGRPIRDVAGTWNLRRPARGGRP